MFCDGVGLESIGGDARWCEDCEMMIAAQARGANVDELVDCPSHL